MLLNFEYVKLFSCKGIVVNCMMYGCFYKILGERNRVEELMYWYDLMIVVRSWGLGVLRGVRYGRE